MDVLIRKEHDAPVLAKQGVCAHQRELGWGGFVLTKGTGTSTEGRVWDSHWEGKESGTNSTEWGDLGPALWVRGLWDQRWVRESGLVLGQGGLEPALGQGGLGSALGQRESGTTTWGEGSATSAELESL